jgi:uncharacterized protein (DUF2141 family)
MNRVLLTTILLSLFTVLFSFAPAQSRGTLEITFTGIRNTQGLIAIGINESPEGWPRKPDMEPNWKKTKIKSGSMTVQVRDLPYGTYAISVLDDENSNLDMDHLMGIPQEGFGFSNNPKVGMTVPKFKACSFVIEQALTKISIEIKYMKKEK